MAERWLPVVGYEGLYEVSDLGRVRSYARSSVPRIRKLGRHSRTFHPKVTLHREGFRKTCPIHQLVAKAFMGPCPEGREVRHRNGQETDNSLDNLQYATQSQNTQDRKWHKGPSLGHKLRPAEVREIKAILGAVSNRELARMFGVSHSTINAIARNVFHRDVMA